MEQWLLIAIGLLLFMVIVDFEGYKPDLGKLVATGGNRHRQYG